MKKLPIKKPKPKAKPPSAGRGRKFGEINKTTKLVKGAMTEAFERLGGVDGLVAWGRENQTDFYKLWIKLLPLQIKTSSESLIYAKMDCITIDGNPLRFDVGIDAKKMIEAEPVEE